MSRGGKRAGAGRPKGSKRSAPSKIMRIPEKWVQKVYQYIEHDGYELPLYSSRVSAGFPSPADDHLEDKLNLNTHLIKNPVSTFFVEVSGESMIDAGINPNDILIIDKSIKPAHGKIAVVFLNGDFTVKRLKFDKELLISLLPENKDYTPISISENDHCEIWGIVTHVIHSYE